MMDTDKNRDFLQKFQSTLKQTGSGHQVVADAFLQTHTSYIVNS